MMNMEPTFPLSDSVIPTVFMTNRIVTPEGKTISSDDMEYFIGTLSEASQPSWLRFLFNRKYSYRASSLEFGSDRILLARLDISA